MIIVHDTFICKPGNASKLAKLMKEAMDSVPMGKARILTDLVGNFNTVVVETELNNLGDFERRMEEYRNDTKFHAKMSGYTDLYVSGKREIYQIH